ncbi:MAG: hypothetical protein LBD21_10140 [Tannerellaceae bacterium]|jgi:hypothetical protein|nr:hypothetical protein [Tannerellaceae bacterium]
MKKLFFWAVSAMLLMSMSAGAQTRFEWKQYGLSFGVPSGFKVSKNTATSFEASNANINLTIEVFDHDDISGDALGEALGGLAGELDMEDAEVGELRLSTLEGAYIEGTVDDAGTILVMLVDSESNIALLATIVYADGYEKQATNICNSFTIK